MGLDNFISPVDPRGYITCASFIGSEWWVKSISTQPLSNADLSEKILTTNDSTSVGWEVAITAIHVDSSVFSSIDLPRILGFVWLVNFFYHGMFSWNLSHMKSSSEPGSKLLVLGMEDLPPLMTGIFISWGPINPYGIGLIFPIPYYMEILGV